MTLWLHHGSFLVCGYVLVIVGEDVHHPLLLRIGLEDWVERGIEVSCCNYMQIWKKLLYVLDGLFHLSHLFLVGLAFGGEMDAKDKQIIG